MARHATHATDRRQAQRELCNVRDCHRRAYARGFCPTHYRQMLTMGTVKPIRPYRERNPDTVKFAGLRLSPSCVEKIQRLASKNGLSDGAAIAQILEAWRKRAQREEHGRTTLASPER